MGLAPRGPGFQGKVTMSPDNVSIDFNDGLNGENNNK
jgi:hypothetical protein